MALYSRATREAAKSTVVAEVQATLEAQALYEGAQKRSTLASLAMASTLSTWTFATKSGEWSRSGEYPHLPGSR